MDEKAPKENGVTLAPSVDMDLDADDIDTLAAVGEFGFELDTFGVDGVDGDAPWDGPSPMYYPVRASG